MSRQPTQQEIAFLKAALDLDKVKVEDFLKKNPDLIGAVDENGVNALRKVFESYNVINEKLEVRKDLALFLISKGALVEEAIGQSLLLVGITKVELERAQKLAAMSKARKDMKGDRTAEEEKN